MKTLVTWFSAEGNTAKVGRELAEKLGADVFEIVPEVPYTKADIRWMNPLARCNKEKFGKKEVPVGNRIENFSDYDTVFLGFPIWYGCAPNVVNTFCQGYDWSGKRVFLFATSGGGGMGKSAEKLSPYMPGATIAGEKLVKKPEEVKIWLETVL